jgi:hypothetical protein
MIDIHSFVQNQKRDTCEYYYYYYSAQISVIPNYKKKKPSTLTTYRVHICNIIIFYPYSNNPCTVVLFFKTLCTYIALDA